MMMMMMMMMPVSDPWSAFILSTIDVALYESHITQNAEKCSTCTVNITSVECTGFAFILHFMWLDLLLFESFVHTFSRTISVEVESYRTVLSGVTLNNASDYRTNRHYWTPNPNPRPLAR